MACCAIAQVFIIRSIQSVRQQTPSADVPRSRDTLELVWAVLPAIALGVLLHFTWRAIKSHQAASGEAHASSGIATNLRTGGPAC